MTMTEPRASPRTCRNTARMLSCALDAVMKEIKNKPQFKWLGSCWGKSFTCHRYALSSTPSMSTWQGSFSWFCSFLHYVRRHQSFEIVLKSFISFLYNQTEINIYGLYGILAFMLIIVIYITKLTKYKMQKRLSLGHTVKYGMV